VEILSKLTKRNPVTSSVIEPAICRLVAYCFNQLWYNMPSSCNHSNENHCVWDVTPCNMRAFSQTSQRKALRSIHTKRSACCSAQCHIEKSLFSVRSVAPREQFYTGPMDFHEMQCSDGVQFESITSNSQHSL
jgi:hypothetical protein